MIVLLILSTLITYDCSDLPARKGQQHEIYGGIAKANTLYQSGIDLINMLIDCQLILTVDIYNYSYFIEKGGTPLIQQAKDDISPQCEEILAGGWENICKWGKIKKIIKGKFNNYRCCILTNFLEPDVYMNLAVDNIVFLKILQICPTIDENHEVISEEACYVPYDKVYGIIPLNSPKQIQYWNGVKTIFDYIYNEKSEADFTSVQHSPFSTIQEAFKLLRYIDQSPKYHELYQKLYRESKNPRLKARIKKRVKVEE